MKCSVGWCASVRLDHYALWSQTASQREVSDTVADSVSVLVFFLNRSRTQLVAVGLRLQ